MSIPIPRPLAPPFPSRTLPARQTEYLVSHGKSGAFALFVADVPMWLERGDRVVIVSSRGQEVGSVLCPANSRHGQYLPDSPPGKLMRPATADDELALARLADLCQAIFAESRELAERLDLP